MPRNDLPRTVVSTTLNDAQMQRLDELCAQLPSNTAQSYGQLLLEALRVYDVAQGITTTSVFGSGQ